MRLIFSANVYYLGAIVHPNSDEEFEVQGRLDDHVPDIFYTLHKEGKCRSRKEKKVPVSACLGDE